MHLGKGKKTKDKAALVEEAPHEVKDTTPQETEQTGSLMERLQNSRTLPLPKDNGNHPDNDGTARSVLSDADMNTQSVGRMDKEGSSLPQTSRRSARSSTEEDDVLQKLIGLSLYGAGGDGLEGSVRGSERLVQKNRVEMNTIASQGFKGKNVLPLGPEQTCMTFQGFHEESSLDASTKQVASVGSGVQGGHAGQIEKKHVLRGLLECDRNPSKDASIQEHNSKDSVKLPSHSPQRGCRRKTNNSKRNPSRSRKDRESPTVTDKQQDVQM